MTPQMEQVTGAMHRFTAATERANSSQDSANIRWMTQFGSIMSVYGGVRRITFSMRELGLVSTETAKSIASVTNYMGLLVGSYQMLKGGIKIMNELRKVEQGHALVLTYKSILQKPQNAALAMAAVGITGFVAGALWQMSKREAAASEQVVNFNPYATPDEREVARGALNTLGSY